MARTKRPRGSTLCHRLPHATFTIQLPADVFRIDVTRSGQAHHPLFIAAAISSEAEPSLKRLPHRVLCILELCELVKS